MAFPSPVPTKTGPAVSSLAVKDTELQGKTREQSTARLVRFRLGTLSAVLALTFGAAAMPAALVYNRLLGAGLAGLGMFLGAVGLISAIKRRGVGWGLPLAGTGVCGSVLFAAIMLLGMGNLPDDRGDSVLDRLFGSTPPDPDMMRYLPSNSQLVVSIRTGRIADSEFFRESARRSPDLRMLENAFEGWTGLPPTQLTRIMISLRISGGRDAVVCVCRLKNPVRVADILANMRDSNYREEKDNPNRLYVNKEEAFCIVRKDLILFGPTSTIREILLRDGPPELSSGLQTALREADFSKDVAGVANAKDIFRKASPFTTNAAVGWSQELTDAAIRANAVFVFEMTFGRAIERRVKICCNDAATAKELLMLQEEAIAKAKADPNTPKAAKKNLASDRWALHDSRIIGTGTIEVETFVEMIEENRKKAAPWAVPIQNWQPPPPNNPSPPRLQRRAPAR